MWRLGGDPLASYSGGILGGIHWRATLGYQRDTPTNGLLWWDPLAGGILGGSELLWDTQAGYSRDPLTGCSGGILGGMGGMHWRTALVGFWPGSTGEPLWRDTTGWDPPACSAGSTGLLGGVRSGGILGGIHWRAALAGHSAGSAGEQLWREILGGIHWRGYWVGAWCRSIANTDSNIKSNNPFLSGGKKYIKCPKLHDCQQIAAATLEAHANCLMCIAHCANKTECLAPVKRLRLIYSRRPWCKSCHPNSVHMPGALCRLT